MRHKLLFFSVLLELVLCGGAAIAWGGHTDAAHAASPTPTVITTVPVGSRPVDESDSLPRAVALTTTATANALLPSGGPTTLVKASVFAKKTSTGSQAVTGVGFKPKLLILFGVAKTSDGITGGFQYGFGASDGSTSEAIGGWSWDARGGSGSDTDRRDASKAITFVTTVGGIVAEAGLTSFDTDGFTLNWTTNNVAAWVIYYLAIGGGAEYQVRNFTATAGQNSYTHVGFKPDLLLLFGAPSAFGPLESSFGFADGNGNQFAMSGASQNSGTNPTNTARYQRTDKCFASLDPVSTIHVEAEASLVSMDSLGFTLNWTGSSQTIVSVAIRGISAKVGSISPGWPGGDIATTGAGFQPKGALFAGFNSTTSTSVVANNRITLGVADTDRNQGSIWVGDRDNVSADTQTDQATCDHKCYIYTDAGVPAANGAVLKSWDSDGFTLTWDYSAVMGEEVGYLLIGDYPSGTVAPVGGIAEPPEATLGGASGNAVPLPMVAGLLGVAGAMLAGALGAWRVYSVRRR